MKPPGTAPKTRVIDLQASIAALDTLPVEHRVRLAMQIASDFLEYAAYEMAVDQNAEDVSEIILMAARLDMAAKRRKERTFSHISAHRLRDS